MKMYEVLELQNLYNSIANIKLPLKTTYKFSRLMRRAEEEISFYQEKFREIVEEYGVKENGEYKYHGDSIDIAFLVLKEKLVDDNKIKITLHNEVLFFYILTS